MPQGSAGLGAAASGLPCACPRSSHVPALLAACSNAPSFAVAIMGDLHLEPGHQMPVFEEARRQLISAVNEPGIAAPRVVQLGEPTSKDRAISPPALCAPLLCKDPAH